MRVMAMMMLASEHETFKVRDRRPPVNSKELMGTIGIHDGGFACTILANFEPEHTQSRCLIK